MQPGMLAIPSSEDHEGKASLILSSSQHGFLSLPSKVKKTRAEHLCLYWEEASPAKIGLEFVVEPRDWKILPLQSIAPGNPSYDKTPPFFDGMQVLAPGVSMDLLEFSARSGFRGITTELLRRMFNDLEVKYTKGAKPNTQAALVRALVQHILPQCSPEEHQEFCMSREEEAEDFAFHSDKFFEQDALDGVLEELADHDLADEVAKQRELAEKRKIARETKKAKFVLPTPAGSANADPPEIVVEILRAIVWHEHRGLTQPESKAYLPPGAYVRKDVNRDPRWQIRASYLVPSVSRAYIRNVVKEDDNAFLACLRRAWCERTLQYGDVCPFDLDGPLL